MQAKEEKRKED